MSYTETLLPLFLRLTLLFIYIHLTDYLYLLVFPHYGHLNQPGGCLLPPHPDHRALAVVESPVWSVEDLKRGARRVPIS